MENQHIVTFKDDNATGIDQVPLGSIVHVKSSGKFYQHNNPTGVTPTSKVSDASKTNLGIRGEWLSRAMFHGGGLQTNVNTNMTALISSTGTLLKPESAISDAHYGHASASMGAFGMMYGGFGIASLNKTSTCTEDSTIVVLEGNAGTARRYLVGSNVGVNALFYGGMNSSNVAVSLTTLLTPTTTLAQSESSVGLIRYAFAGAKVGAGNLMAHGGNNNGAAYVATVTLLSPTATLIQAETSVTDPVYTHSGAELIDGNAMFYGGYSPSLSDATNGCNVCRILTPTATLAQASTSIGTVRNGNMSARAGFNVIIYGGVTSVNLLNTKILTSTGTLVQPETTVGTQRASGTGFSI